MLLSDYYNILVQPSEISIDIFGEYEVLQFDAEMQYDVTVARKKKGRPVPGRCSIKFNVIRLLDNRPKDGLSDIISMICVESRCYIVALPCCSDGEIKFRAK